MPELSDMEKIEKAELLAAVQELMLRHPDLDWTMAAQSVAMSSGRAERAVLDMLREDFM